MLNNLLNNILKKNLDTTYHDMISTSANTPTLLVKKKRSHFLTELNAKSIIEIFQIYSIMQPKYVKS